MARQRGESCLDKRGDNEDSGTSTEQGNEEEIEGTNGEVQYHSET
jgi:hypothetical protein